MLDEVLRALLLMTFTSCAMTIVVAITIIFIIKLKQLVFESEE